MLPRRLFLEDLFDDENKEMKCDVYEKDGIYHIEADIPGFDKNDIKIELNKGTISIIAEKKAEDSENKKYLRRERVFYGKYTRSFYLGEVDEENIEAEFNNGILKITVPKQNEDVNKKTIEIK